MSWIEFFAVVLPPAFWPFTVAFVAMVLGPKLIAELPRVHKLGPAGVELFRLEPTQESSAEDLGSGLAIENLEELGDPVAKELEQTILEDISKFPEQERQERLVRALTNSQMARSFLLAYSSIFGSQIRALERLNTRHISRDEAQDMFLELQSSDPVFEGWTLDDYLQFLIHWKFIEYENTAYHITTTGQNFLLFLTSSQLLKDRLH